MKVTIEFSSWEEAQGFMSLGVKEAKPPKKPRKKKEEEKEDPGEEYAGMDVGELLEAEGDLLKELAVSKREFLTGQLEKYGKTTLRGLAKEELVAILKAAKDA